MNAPGDDSGVVCLQHSGLVKGLDTVERELAALKKEVRGLVVKVALIAGALSGGGAFLGSWFGG